MSTPAPIGPSWKVFNLLARCYLDFQHTRIATEHRLKGYRQNVWIAAGIMVETKTTKADHNGKIRTKIERKFVDPGTDEGRKSIKQQAVAIEKQLQQNDEAYSEMFNMANKMKDDEGRMLARCKDMFKTTPLWEWCERVAGLGPVACMTLIGYIAPRVKDKVTGELRTTRVADVWKFFGLSPDSKVQAGVKSNFNLELKGRMFLLARNIVMQRDSYYAGTDEKPGLYRLKKEYYKHIDEILEKKNIKRGWDGWVDAMAKKVMIKIVVSHAVEIIVKTQGLPFESKHENNRYLPPKPEDEYDVQKFLKLWADDMPAKIEQRNQRYRKDKEAGLIGPDGKRLDTGEKYRDKGGPGPKPIEPEETDLPTKIANDSVIDEDEVNDKSDEDDVIKTGEDPEIEEDE